MALFKNNKAKNQSTQDQNLKPVLKGSGQGTGKKHMLHRLEALEEELAGSLSYTGNARWMIPYADLLTILLGLFLVMLSLSTFDNKKLNNYANQVSETLHMKEEIMASQNNKLTELKQKLEAIQNRSRTPVELLDHSNSNAEEVFNTLAIESQNETIEDSEKNSKKDIQINQEERGLVISITNSVLFDSGSAELSKEAKITLKEVAEVLKAESHLIRVEGHTDNSPIATSKYASNWELSTARATSIIRFLVEEQEFDPAKLSASGYGQYHPISENSSVEGKQKNRRVDIVVLNKQAIQWETPK